MIKQHSNHIGLESVRTLANFTVNKFSLLVDFAAALGGEHFVGELLMGTSDCKWLHHKEQIPNIFIFKMFEKAFQIDAINKIAFAKCI